MHLLLTIAFLFVFPSAGIAGWNFEKHTIQVDEILSGGPPKDGIPALFSPKYVSADAASFMLKDEKVIGVILNGNAKAYPLRIMSWHELVNDRIADIPFLVSW